MESRRFVTTLVLAAVLSLVVGVGIGALLNLPALRFGQSDDAYELSGGLKERLEGGSGASDQPREVVTLAGIVRLSASVGDIYQLMNAGGEILAMLESNEIDLGLVEGSSVTIVGEVMGQDEGGVPLVRVTEVQF